MAMRRSDRYELNRRLLGEIYGWPDEDINLLLDSFQIKRALYSWQRSDLGDTLAAAPDRNVVELYASVMKVPESEVLASAVLGVDDSAWRPGHVRLFISHSATHKTFVSEVAGELSVLGIHGFVAHETMEVGRQWQTQIENALRSMQAFVALVHPEFVESTWCQQEVGWALGRRVPHYAIRLGKDPSAFLGSSQWPSAIGKDPKDVAQLVAAWIYGDAELGEATIESLITALAEAPSFIDASNAAKRLVAVGRLSETAWSRLAEAYFSNNQVHGGVLAHRVLEPFYRKNGREFPPSKPGP